MDRVRANTLLQAREKLQHETGCPTTWQNCVTHPSHAICSLWRYPVLAEIMLRDDCTWPGNREILADVLRQRENCLCMSCTSTDMQIRKMSGQSSGPALLNSGTWRWAYCFPHSWAIQGMRWLEGSITTSKMSSILLSRWYVAPLVEHQSQEGIGFRKRVEPLDRRVAQLGVRSRRPFTTSLPCPARKHASAPGLHHGSWNGC